MTPVGSAVVTMARLTEGHRAAMSLAAALTLTASLLGLAQPLLAKGIVDGAGRGGAWWPMVLLATLFLTEAVVGALGRFLLERMGEGVVRSVRHNLVTHLLSLEMRVYDRHRRGDLLARVTTDTTLLREVVAQALVDLVTGAIVAVGALLLMLWLDPLLLLLVALTVAVAALVVTSLLARIRTASEQMQQSVGEISADLDRALGALRMVRVHRAEQREAARVGRRVDAAYQAGVRTAKLASVMSPAVELAVQGSFLLVLVIGGMRVAGGSSSQGELVAFLLYASYLVVPLSSVFRAVGEIQKGMGAYHRVDQALALPAEPPELRWSGPPRRSEEEAADRPARGRPPVLAMRDVWFGYHPERPVLRGLSLEVPARCHVALVGRSGVGKSTVFALAARFYEPDAGTVLFSDSPATDLGRSECRSRIALVDQDAPVVRGSLWDNITYAVPDAPTSEVLRVVRLAGLEEVVARMPDGLWGEVGDGGGTLSAGERQRVAVARALLTRPRLLLLDEPTSHLDAVNEAALTRVLRDVAQECALLVIAHRLATVQHADRICVLDGGRVVDAGRHDELFARSAAYRELAVAQMLRPAQQPGAGSPLAPEPPASDSLTSR